MSDIEDLEAMVRELRDTNAIHRLKASYCALVDSGDWDELETLWSEDAVCDYDFFGRFEGRAQIMQRFFRDQVSAISTFNAHMIHNGIIDVTGDTARGRWYLTAHTTAQPGDRAMWVHAIYDDAFARIGEQWKIAAIKVTFRYFTPFEQGWAKQPFWQAGNSGS
ncbi:MAG: nuclear transport factor 2 family protein [Halioglobus sp.]|nr:nuclear transport factor 2 family protein [Halioglobus sp.]